MNGILRHQAETSLRQRTLQLRCGGLVIALSCDKSRTACRIIISLENIFSSIRSCLYGPSTDILSSRSVTSTEGTGDRRAGCLCDVKTLFRALSSLRPSITLIKGTVYSFLWLLIYIHRFWGETQGRE